MCNRYVNDVRECLRNRIQCGMLQDEALLIQENCYMELTQINEIKEKHKRYADSFDEFLAEDHRNARKFLEEADLMSAKTMNLTVEKKELSVKLGMLRCELYTLEETWRELKMYQSFLYRVAPLSWRLEHDWIHRDSHDNLLQEGQTQESKMKKEESVLSLDDLLVKFLDLTEKSPEPMIPFSTPGELLETLDALAESTLHSLAHLEKIAGPLAAAKVNAEAAKVEVEAELTAMRRNIDSLSRHIDWEERRGRSLKARGESLLEGALRKCVEAELTAMRRNIDSLSRHIDWEERRGRSLKARGESLLGAPLENA
ncbi:uncharacterized protein LOC113388266 [Ctenocephalides felis]|uniref:uncharacterized protein LOC113388266 n=1 Tax=Ctenocephalides felis TaxID=7515 RepID=UPI000E6E223B|nr:uncharacterized protein LOC113388266 [Ctenocephalides felis]